MAGLSLHARKRAAQRGLSTEELVFVMFFGRRIFRTGICFFFLGERDIPERLQKTHGYLAGTTVLLSQDCTVLTVYKNADALKPIKKKSKNRRCDPALRPA